MLYLCLDIRTCQRFDNFPCHRILARNLTGQSCPFGRPSRQTTQSVNCVDSSKILHSQERLFYSHLHHTFFTQASSYEAFKTVDLFAAKEGASRGSVT